MAAIINILSEKKGSNPGGKCYLQGGGRLNVEAYFKYCYKSSLGASSCFIPDHQPFYEVITFELARVLGLKTVDAFVLSNINKDIKFIDWKKYNFSSDPSGRSFYFLSLWFNRPTGGMIKNHRYEVPENEKVYLESLLISDIVGKPNNYTISLGEPHEINYLDLGCSFVHANNGFLKPQNKFRLKEPKELKRDKRNLRSVSIIGADNDKIIALDEFVDLPYQMKITTLNPWKQILVSDVLSRCELDEIHWHLVQSFSENLPKFKEKGLVI